MHTPDKWIIIQVQDDLYKVFAVWGGSYLHGQSWQINSGIERVEKEDDFYIFYGFSGSRYKCYKNNYGSTAYGYSILDGYKKQIESSGLGKIVILKDRNWIKFFK